MCMFYNEKNKKRKRKKKKKTRPPILNKSRFFLTTFTLLKVIWNIVLYSAGQRQFWNSERRFENQRGDLSSVSFPRQT